MSTALCLICNGSCLSTRNSIQIFNKENITCSGNPLVAILGKVLNKEIAEDFVHSKVICKKCFKTLDELDELEVQYNKISNDILLNYKNTLEKRSEENDREKDGLDMNKLKEESNKENEVPKKILDIPSSDDDASQIPSDKHSFQTIEDIEMELVKMHGNIHGTDQDKLTGDIVTVGSFHNYEDGEDIDSGAVEHSSDSDYEPPKSSDDLVKEAALLEKTIAENSAALNIKQEPLERSSDRPNILKKKSSISEVKENGLKQIKDEFSTPVVSRENTLYTCLLCTGANTVAGEAKGIIAHMKTEHEVRLYICDVCGADFRKRNELSAHLDEHVATEEGDFQCEVCNRIFNNLRLFRIHRRMHYPQHKAWECETCGKKYSSKNLLDEHINTHTGVRPYICQLCGKDFASKYTYKAHEKTHEVRPRPFQCQQCGKTFLSAQNLSQHERTHLGIKEFSCHLCGKQFGSAHNLEVHSIVHTGYKPFACGLCGKAFARKAEIRDHERTHTGERPYQCEFCGATFSQRSNLQSHKRATHYDDKRHKCEECGKAFKRRRLLDYHVKAAHTGERPFKCTVCEATFVYPEHFKKHRRIHTGEKPFRCEVCGKAFNSRDNRNAHRFVHSDKKPYECLVCGAGFMRKPLLYQHMQTRGHLNDTIVVNQPRLTTDDDQLVTVNADGEMEIVEPSSVTEDSKLYIAEHVLTEGDVLNEGDEGPSAVEHIIIDGQQISFAEEDIDGEGELVGGDYEEEIISSDVLAGSETQIIDTPDGPIQLVKVRIPNENGEEQEAWVKIVPE